MKNLMVKDSKFCNDFDAYDLNGTKEHVVSYISELMDKAQEKFPNEEIHLYYDDDDMFIIKAVTYETIEERTERFKIIEENRQKANEKLERETYERLKKKYENEI